MAPPFQALPLIIASAPWWHEPANPTTDSGKVWVFNSKDMTTPLCTISGIQNSALFGVSLLSLGDINGYNKGDFAVGEPNYDVVGATTDSGRVHIVSGADCTTLYVLNGDTTNGRFGSSMAIVGDTLNNTYKTIAIGEPGDYRDRFASGMGSFIGQVHVYRFPVSP